MFVESSAFLNERSCKVAKRCPLNVWKYSFQCDTAQNYRTITINILYIYKLQVRKWTDLISLVISAGGFFAIFTFPVFFVSLPTLQSKQKIIVASSFLLAVHDNECTITYVFFFWILEPAKKVHVNKGLFNKRVPWLCLTYRIFETKHL